MKHAEIVAALQELKRTGAWERIAKVVGVDYFTVSRIARQNIKDPGVHLCERLGPAIRAELDARPTAGSAVAVQGG
jgi:hypothetical protein